MSRTISSRWLFAAIVLLATALAVPAASGASQASQKLTVYAVPTTVQFMNHADDRLRGMSTNPFKLKSDAVIIGANGKEKGYGPFPGDDILYGFKIFSDAKRTKPIGTAMFTCYFQFAEARDLRLVLRPRQGPPARIRAGAVRRQPTSRSGSPAARRRTSARSGKWTPRRLPATHSGSPSG